MMGSITAYLWEWVTSGAILILALFLAAPVLHAVQIFQSRRRLFQRLAAGRLNPNGFEARLTLGEIYARGRRYAKAIPELEAAVEINPDHAHCKSLLGKAYFKAGRFAEAAAQLEKTLEIRPDHGYGHTHLLLGRVYDAAGDATKAVEWYRAAAARNTSIAEPYYRAALAHRVGGDKEQYMAALAETVSTFSRYDRSNYWRNLRYATLAKLRLASGL